MSDPTPGRRVDATATDGAYPFPRLQPGDYGKDEDGLWYCVPPGKDPFSYLGCLGNGVSHHKITEHEGGTITVSPSILINSYLGAWHGFLERGVWRECQ